MKPLPEKPCASCGRRIVWRSKWRDCWDELKYCSEKCRRHKPGTIGNTIEHTILGLLAKRKAGGTICPSEVARLLEPNDWHQHIEETRNAARRLVARGIIEMTQRGHVVEPSTAKGAIRLRMRTT